MSYFKPKFEVIKFKQTDVIATSGNTSETSKENIAAKKNDQNNDSDDFGFAGMSK